MEDAPQGPAQKTEIQIQSLWYPSVYQDTMETSQANDYPWLPAFNLSRLGKTLRKYGFGLAPDSLYFFLCVSAPLRE